MSACDRLCRVLIKKDGQLVCRVCGKKERV
jgi:uncharacterized Zn finger protein (UPF0148 family)